MKKQHIKEIDKIIDDIREIYPDFIFTSLGVTSTDGNSGISLISLNSYLARNHEVSAFSTMLSLLINNAEKQIEGFNFNTFVLKHNEATKIINKERK